MPRNNHKGYKLPPMTNHKIRDKNRRKKIETELNPQLIGFYATAIRLLKMRVSDIDFLYVMEDNFEIETNDCYRILNIAVDEEESLIAKLSEDYEDPWFVGKEVSCDHCKNTQTLNKKSGVGMYISFFGIATSCPTCSKKVFVSQSQE